MVKVKVPLFRGCFSHFLNRTNGTKSREASHITTAHPNKEPFNVIKTKVVEAKS